MRAAWRDGTPGRDRIFVVIEVQSTGGPGDAVPGDAARRHARPAFAGSGQYPVPRIRTVVLYTEEKPWDARLDTGESFADLMVDSRPRVVYELVDLHRLELEPGTRNLVRLLAGVVRGDTLEGLARAVRALAERVAELGDGKLEESLFALVRAQGSEKWPDFEWKRCENLAELVRQLEEGEMTWPEKWIEQMRPQFEERLRRELEPKVTEQLRAELLPTVKEELRAELREAHREE